MRIRGYGPRPRLADKGVHVLSQKSADSEASYVIKYKTRNFTASGLSWEAGRTRKSCFQKIRIKEWIKGMNDS